MNTVRMEYIGDVVASNHKMNILHVKWWLGFQMES